MSDATITDNDRRRFIRAGMIGLTLAPLGSLLLTRGAEARGSGGIKGPSSAIARLPENDKQAMALGYKEDANLVDTTKFSRGKDQLCQNCQLYSGSAGEEWGPCAIFSYRIDPKLNQNYVVSGKGWCRSWAPRASG